MDDLFISILRSSQTADSAGAPGFWRRLDVRACLTKFISLLVGIQLLGCGGTADTRPSRVPVSGKVTLDGKAVADAFVVFNPQAGGLAAAQGTTDANGHYELTTFDEADGAMPGSYQVLISKEIDENPMSAKDSQAYYLRTGRGPPPPIYTDLLPANYKQPGTSSLKANVVEGGENTIDFPLSKAGT